MHYVPRTLGAGTAFALGIARGSRAQSLASRIDRGTRRYAGRRESQRFSKEALYKASAMRSRLAAIDEREAWSRDLEAEKASFLRRKLEQGRRFDPPGKNPRRS